MQINGNVKFLHVFGFVISLRTFSIGLVFSKSKKQTKQKKIIIEAL